MLSSQAKQNPPENRKLEGGEFASEIPDDDIKTICEKMLNDQFLDAERFPQLKIQGVTVEGQLPDLQIKFEVTIHGLTKEFQAPFQIQITGEQLRAIGISSKTYRFWNDSTFFVLWSGQSTG